MDQNEFINMDNIKPSETAISKKLRAVFTSNAFLTATIAFTVVAALSLMIGSLDIFATLFAIGMWLAYSASKSASPKSAVKFLSGTVKAYYIVNIIGIVCLIVSGVLLIAVAPSVFELKDGIYDILNTASEGYSNLFMAVSGEDIEIVKAIDSWVAENVGVELALFFGAVMIILGVVFIISAALTLVINIFFVKNLSKILIGCTSALENESECEINLSSIRAWLIVLGVFSAVSAVSSLLGAGIFAAASGGATATACIALSKAFEKEAATDTDNTQI